MLPILRVVAAAALCLCSVYGQDDTCTTPTFQQGTCVVMDKCQELKHLIKGSAEERAKLRTYHCGFIGDIPKVCCPPKTNNNEQMNKSTCVTQEGTIGQCVDVRSCPYITNMLKTRSVKSMEYYSRSRCEGPTRYHVCCDKVVATNLLMKEDPSSENRFESDDCPLSATPPTYESKCCGVESSSGNKIIGGYKTGIDEYPWLVFIEDARTQKCGGSLISNLYVLTAAHCLQSSGASRNPSVVVVGDYNITNEGADCIEVEGGGEDCTTGAIRIPIESTIVHPEYNKQKGVNFANDIALIRLARMAPYSDFVRPICLPTSDITRDPPSNIRFYMAGWGAVDPNHSSSDSKLQVDVPYVEPNICRSKYTRKGATIIWEKQICAGGEPDKDSCKGDSGGPLMYIRGQDEVKEIVGVISYGLIQCGTDGTPSIYTKVFDYLDWIRSNIKP